MTLNKKPVEKEYDDEDKSEVLGNLVKVIGKVRTIDGECNCFLY